MRLTTSEKEILSISLAIWFVNDLPLLTEVIEAGITSKKSAVNACKEVYKLFSRLTEGMEDNSLCKGIAISDVKGTMIKAIFELESNKTTT